MNVLEEHMEAFEELHLRDRKSEAVCQAARFVVGHASGLPGLFTVRDEPRFDGSLANGECKFLYRPPEELAVTLRLAYCSAFLQYDVPEKSAADALKQEGVRDILQKIGSTDEEFERCFDMVKRLWPEIERIACVACDALNRVGLGTVVVTSFGNVDARGGKGDYHGETTLVPMSDSVVRRDTAKRIRWYSLPALS